MMLQQYRSTYEAVNQAQKWADREQRVFLVIDRIIYEASKVEYPEGVRAVVVPPTGKYSGHNAESILRMYVVR